jgi:2'-5' RNA ligase
LRSFIAIELPDLVKLALAALQLDLKKCGADIRWVKSENIHLTLKFLGNVDGKKIENIVKHMEGACADYSNFNLEISGAGVFPNIRSPRIFWAGIKVTDTLSELYREIDQKMASLGFEQEKRKFAPHLTLGRFRSVKGKAALVDKIEAHKNDLFGEIDVRTISLMKSDLSSAGAKYSRIAEVSLGK